MARSGLLAGLEGYASVAEGPGKRLGEGISGMVDKGLEAYTAVSRVRQGEEEGQRSQQRLDMTQAMQPGLLRGQQLDLDQKGMAIEEAGRKVERQKRQDEAGTIIRERAAIGFYKDNPQAFKEDMLGFTMIGGDSMQTKAALRDYDAAVVQKGEAADQLNRITSEYHGMIAEANAHTGPDATEKSITTIANWIAKHQKENPVGAAASPELKYAHDALNKLVGNTQPQPIRESWDKYTQNRASNKMTPQQAWQAAQVGLGPEQIARMDTLKPTEVKDAEAVAKGGAETKAKEAELRPGRLELETLKGQNARALQDQKAESARDVQTLRNAGRAEAVGMNDKNLKLAIDGILKDMSLDERTLTSLITTDDAKAAAQQRLNMNRDRIGHLTTEAARRSMNPGQGAPAAPSGPPSQEAVADAVEALTKHLATPSPFLRDARIKHQLDAAVANGKLTKAGADQVRERLSKGR